MTVKVTQFGGHVGSTAGDCAVVTIADEDRAYIVVIDTGASAIWSKWNELATYVQRQFPQHARPEVWLISTHFHEDHYDPRTAGPLKPDFHVFSGYAWKNAGKPDPAGTPVVLENLETVLPLKTKLCTIRCYMPPDGDPYDQNDQSLAVEVVSEEVSLMSFGDMTADAYGRLIVARRKHLPPAACLKYPHHGNPGENWLAYFDRDLRGCSVLISGDSRSGVRKTITTLLRNGVGAVYLLARTEEARAEFKRSWSVPNTPVYVCNDVELNRGIYIKNDDGQFFERIVEQGQRRERVKQGWKQVAQDWQPGEAMSED